MKTLAAANPDPTATLSGVGTVTGCTTGYLPPVSLTSASPVAWPTSGGAFYTAAELSIWRQRVAAGKYFIKDGDYTKGAPGDWGRIKANAEKFFSSGGETDISNLSTYGALARDAAFSLLISTSSDATTSLNTSKLISYLVSQSKNTTLDFPTQLCIRESSGNFPDAWHFQSSWLLRYIATYDFIRSKASNADKLTIENFIRRNAYFLAAHTDYGLAYIFPNRLKGDYSKVASSAAAKTDGSQWLTKRYDTNDDCNVDTKDLSGSYMVGTYLAYPNSPGPKISTLSQWYNNRRSLAAAAFGAAGVLLGDGNLIASSKRYFMEWLTYSVWPDGSQGEYARNGDYCIAGQGLIYGASNEFGAALVARMLARQGDSSLANFSTTSGLYGTESATNGTGKSIELAITTHLKLMRGDIKWYYYRPWLNATESYYSEKNRIGAIENQYMGSGKGMDDYHELGLLQAAALYQKNTTITTFIIRSDQSKRFPGSTGNSVSTGYGDWSDPANTLPAHLLTRPTNVANE